MSDLGKGLATCGIWFAVYKAAIGPFPPIAFFLSIAAAVCCVVIWSKQE